MAHSFSKIIIHIVFSTKKRASLIEKKRLNELHAYIAGICRKLEAPAFRVGGTGNHVHLACALPRTMTVSDLVKKIKLGASKWFNSSIHPSKYLYWQEGYGAFSVGYSRLGELLNYIDNQENHHKTVGYEEEFLAFLKHYQVAFNKQYLWRE